MEEIIKEHGGYIVIALLAITLAFMLGYESGSQAQGVRTIIVQPQQNQQNASLEEVDTSTLVAFQSISLLLPGIDEERQGITANLQVEKRDGTGRVFIDIDEGAPFVANETQTSIKIALQVARRFSDATANGVSTSDLFYSLKARTLEVGGSSAGAAITIGTIALLEGRQLNESVAISGSIRPDGSIGLVGGILEKARALKRKGIVTFLVPVGESIQETQVTSGTQTTVQIVNISQETGMNVVEVPNIRQAYYQMVIP